MHEKGILKSASLNAHKSFLLYKQNYQKYHSLKPIDSSELIQKPTRLDWTRPGSDTVSC